MTDKQIPNERRQYEYKSVFTYTDNTTDDNDKIMENLHKQITIDVTQCPYYREGKSCVYLPYKTKCEGDCNWTSYKEMEEQLDQLKAENKTQKETIDGFLTILDKLGKSNIKLRETLTEIKEIINESFGSCYTCNSEIACKKCIRGNILNKISECEGNDGK